MDDREASKAKATQRPAGGEQLSLLSSYALGVGGVARGDEAQKASLREAQLAESEASVQRLSPVDLAALLRDFASFVSKALAQIDRLAQCEALVGVEEADWKERPGLGVDELSRLRSSLSDGLLVCRSLHHRLEAALVSDVQADEGGLCAAKLKRDFLRLNDQYALLLAKAKAEEARRLTNKTDGPSSSPRPWRFSEDREKETRQAHQAWTGTLPVWPDKTEKTEETGDVDHFDACSRLSVYDGHFFAVQNCNLREAAAQGKRQECHGGGAEAGSLGSEDTPPSAEALKALETLSPLLPRLLVGSDAKASAASSGSSFSSSSSSSGGGASGRVLLVQDVEVFERGVLLEKRRRQLEELRHVESCLSALEQMQGQLASDAFAASEALECVASETESAAASTASGALQLAKAAERPSRWWAFQGGGAVGALGLGVGALLGGPVGATLGAFVGALAGASSGAALTHRHRREVRKVEDRLKRRQRKYAKEITAKVQEEKQGDLADAQRHREEAAKNERQRPTPRGKEQRVSSSSSSSSKAAPPRRETSQRGRGASEEESDLQIRGSSASQVMGPAALGLPGLIFTRPLGTSWREEA